MKKIKQKIYQYTAIFDRNTDGAYTITVPSLPGLTTEGRTLEEGKRMALDAIQCYLEGLKKAREKIPVEQEFAQMRISVKI